MHLARLWSFLVFVYLVECRNNVKSLTDSMGQEVIEIGSPVKESQGLPPGLDEEPSAEVEEETSSKAPQPATRRETKRVVTTTTSKPKVVEKEESISQEDEEARIEKELAEIYKDTDYKSDSSETSKVTKMEPNATDDKPIARSRNNFKFQPDVNNRQDIERFRTSVDEISCDRRVTLKTEVPEMSKSTTTSEFMMSLIQMVLVVLSLFICQ